MSDVGTLQKSEIPNPKYNKLPICGDVQSLIKGVRKKFENGFVSPTQPIHIICPINKHAAPYHHQQDWEIDPMQPSYRQRMFMDDLFH